MPIRELQLQPWNVRYDGYHGEDEWDDFQWGYHAPQHSWDWESVAEEWFESWCHNHVEYPADAVVEVMWPPTGERKKFDITIESRPVFSAREQ